MFRYACLRLARWRVTDIGVVLGVLIFFLARPAYAANGVNDTIQLQGKVTNSNGTNVADGAYDFVLKIYDGAGNSATNQFTESWTSAALFSSTMSSAPTTSDDTLVYSSNTNESTLKVGQILWNTTLKESVNITSVNTTTNTLGISRTIQNWSNSDTITNRVYVKDGVFRVAINSLNQNWDQVTFTTDTLFVGVNFNSDGEMKPRMQFRSSVYAQNAKKVNGLTVTNTSDLPFSSTTSLKLTDGSTVTFGGNFSSGSNALTLTTSGSTSLTLPTSGTLATLAGNEALTNKSIGSTGLVFSGATTDVTTGTNEDLVISPNGTGRIGIGITNPTALLDLFGKVTGKALVIFDERGDQDILTASASGAPRFTVTNAGGIKLGTSAGNSGECLKSGGTGASATWGVCATTGSLFTADGGGTFTYLTDTADDLVLGASTVAGAAFHLDITDGAGTPNTTLSLGTDGSKNGILKLFSSTSSKAGTISVNSSGDLTLAAVAGSNTIVGSGTGNISIEPGTDNAVVNLASTGDFLFQDNGVNYAIFDDTGAIGFGTTTPAGRLDIRGLNGTTSTATVSALSAFAAMVVDNSGSGDVFTASTSGQSRFTIKRDGRIQLSSLVYGSSCTALETDANGYITCGTDATGTSQWSDGTGGIYYNSGNVGIGTTDPSLYKLFVNGTANSKALSVINGDGNQELFTASVSGTTKFLISKTGNVGIGTSGPIYPLHVSASSSGILREAQGGSALTGSTGQVSYYGTTNQSSLFGSVGYVEKWGAGLITNARGLQGYVNNQNVGDITNAYGATLTVGNFSSGAITNAYGVSVGLSNNVNGTITNGYGMHIASASNLGTFTNNYGLYIADQSAVGSTNSYNFYSAGATAKNYFAGVVGVGNTAPVAKLDLSGAVTGKALAIFNETGNQDIFTASASGTSRFVIKNDGNVGIGINTPDQLLHINSTSTTSLVRFTNSTTGSTISDGGHMGMSGNDLNITNGELGNINFNGASSPRMTLDSIGNVGIGTTAPVGKLNVSGRVTGQALFQLNETGNQALFTASAGGTTRFVIQNDGNVGIGTTTPLAALQVAGFNATSPAASISANTNFAGFLVDNRLGDLFTASASGASRFVVKNNGNVGINASNPTTALYLGGSANTIGFEGHAIIAAGATHNLTLQSGLDFTINVGGSNSEFGVQGDGDVTLDGQLGVGTSAPVGKLHVVGARTGKALAILNETGNQAIFTASASGTTRFVIQNDGNVGIGTTTPGQALDVNGTVNATAYQVGGTAGATGTNGCLTTSNGLITSVNSCSGFTNYWEQANGAINVTNSELDVLLGSTATGSAKFAFNMDSGVLTAYGMHRMQYQFREDFGKQRASATSGGINLGDTLMIDIFEIGTANFLTTADTDNGYTRCTTDAAGDGCNIGLTGLTTGTDKQLNFSADNKPSGLFAARASVLGANNDMYIGFSDDGDDMTTEPTNGAFFTNNDSASGNAWVGVIKSGANRATVTCTGANSQTTNFALFKVELLSTTQARFFVDPDVSDGYNMTSCGVATLGAGTLTAQMSFMLLYRVNTSGTGAANFDVDFIDITQDDPPGIPGLAMVEEVQAPKEFDPEAKADLAEWYMADDPTELIAGTVLSISRTTGNVQKSTEAYEDTLIGVVSTSAHTIMGEEDHDERTVPVALAGRVPVAVSIEGGTIRPGDYLTSSSVPGVAMRATNAGPVIGKALESFDESEIGKVLMYVSPEYYIGVRGEEMLSGLIVSESKDKTSLLPFQQLMRQVTTNSGAVITEVSADRLIAGLEVVAPKVAAGEVLAETIKSSSNSGQITLDLSAGGELIVKGLEESGAVFDSQGNASFSGTLTAKRIVADEIVGSSLVEERLTAQEKRLSELETFFGTPSALLNEVVAMQTIDYKPQEFRAPSNQGNLLSLADMAEDETATISGSLRVKGSSLIENVLTVIDTFIANNIVINGLATFVEDSIFQSDVFFKGHVSVSRDTAGVVVVKKGTSASEVEFEMPYDSVPQVTANITTETIEDPVAAIQGAKAILSGGYNFIITKKSEKGFTVLLNKKAMTDITITWTAIQVEEENRLMNPKERR